MVAQFRNLFIENLFIKVVSTVLYYFSSGAILGALIGLIPSPLGSMWFMVLAGALIIGSVTAFLCTISYFLNPESKVTLPWEIKPMSS